MNSLSLLQILTESLNILVILLTTIRILVQAREWASHPMGFRTLFRKLSMGMLTAFGLSHILLGIHVLYQKLTSPPTEEEGRVAAMTFELRSREMGWNILFGFSQFLFILCGALYILAGLERFSVFQPILRFSDTFIPRARLGIGCLFAFGIASNFMYFYALGQKKDVMRIVAMTVVSLYWTLISITEFSISFLMVITFRRIHRSLDRDSKLSSPPSSPVSPTTKTLSLSSTTHSSTHPRLDPQTESTRLVRLLTAMIITDVLAVFAWCSTAFVPSLGKYHDEAAQFSESWAGVHCILGFYFLSRFRSSMLVRGDGVTEMETKSLESLHVGMETGTGTAGKTDLGSVAWRGMGSLNGSGIVRGGREWNAHRV